MYSASIIRREDNESSGVCKMDAAEQLLLGERVCRQLGIVPYHADVLATTKEQMKSTKVLNTRQ